MVRLQVGGRFAQRGSFAAPNAKIDDPGTSRPGSSRPHSCAVRKGARARARADWVMFLPNARFLTRSSDSDRNRYSPTRTGEREGRGVQTPPFSAIRITKPIVMNKEGRKNQRIKKWKRRHSNSTSLIKIGNEIILRASIDLYSSRHSISRDAASLGIPRRIDTDDTTTLTQIQ